MKTPLTLMLSLSILSGALFSQDSTALRRVSWNGALTIGTKNVWRGIDFGNATPTAQGLLTFKPSDQLTSTHWA